MVIRGFKQILSYFVAVIIISGCGSQLNLYRETKSKQLLSPRRVTNLEYAATLEPYLDSKGILVLPGQKLERWSGRSVIGSSRYDLVPID